MMHAIEFSVVLWTDRVEVSSQDFSAMVSAAFPDCRIDWEAGDAITRSGIADLGQLGAPEVILATERSHLGKRFTLSVKSVPDLELELKGEVLPVYGHLGDSLGFVLVPYEPQHLLTMAKAFAEAVDFRHLLTYAGSFEVRIFGSPLTNPLNAAQRHLRIDEFHKEPKVRLHPVEDWRDTFRRGLLRWLEQSNEPKKFNDRTRAFETLDQYATAVADEIEAVSGIREAWIVDLLGYSHDNYLLLRQEQCHAMIDLSGVPKGIFGNVAPNA